MMWILVMVTGAYGYIGNHEQAEAYFKANPRREFAIKEFKTEGECQYALHTHAPLNGDALLVCKAK